jgi:HEAT repeat protein
LRLAKPGHPGDHGRVRTSLLLALLVASCARKLDGKTSAEWAAQMVDERRGAAALTALEQHGVEALDILVEVVGQGPPKARIQAAALLGKLGAPAAPAVPVLTAALESGEKGVRGMAAIALGRIGPDAKDALIPLTRVALEDRDVRVRVAASLAVYGITGDTTAPTQVLFRAFASKDAQVRAMVAEAFAEMGTPILGILITSLRSEDETTRVNAAKTLAAMGPGEAEEARAPLLDALDDPSEAVRVAAAEALTNLGDR